MTPALLISPLTRRIAPGLIRPFAASSLPRCLSPFPQHQFFHSSPPRGEPQHEHITEADLTREDLDEPTDEKRLDVAIVGFPNAGKSQLLNSMIGTKVAAVSRKKHTTRDGILGVKTHEKTQLVFCDTPGFLTTHSKDNVGGDLNLSAKGYMVDVDYSLVVIDAAKSKHTDEYINTITTLMWNALHSNGGKFGIVLNKVDLVKPKSKLLDAAVTFGSMADGLLLAKLKMEHPNKDPATLNPSTDLMPDVFYTCAKKGQNDSGVQDVLNHLLKLAQPNREWLLPEAHAVTPMDYQAQVEEIIREKIYRTLHREVPHKVVQRNRQMELVRGDDNESSVMVIHQDLLVRSKSHLALLNKSTAANLQRIHDSTVPELRRLFQCEVLLTLNAKMISRNQR